MSVVRELDARGATDIVRLGYDALGGRYLSWSRKPLKLRFVRELLARVPRGGRVLDLGCGPGEPVTRLLAERCRVVAVDLSPVQIALARTAAPAASFVVANLTKLGLRPACVDAVACFYVLGHVPAHLHQHVLQDISRSLRPGGILVANTPVRRHEGVENDWLGVKMFFSAIGAEATLATVEQLGLDLALAEQVCEDEGEGSTADFLWFVAKKP